MLLFFAKHVFSNDAVPLTPFCSVYAPYMRTVMFDSQVRHNPWQVSQ